MKVQVRLPSKQSQTSRDISLGWGEFEWEVEQRDDYQLWPQSSCRGGCSSLPRSTSSKLLKEQTSKKTMEEQFPGLTVGTKWGQVAPGVVACSVLWRLFWSRVQTEALILPAVGSFVGCWQFSANLSPGTALSQSAIFSKVTLLPRAKVQLNYQLRGLCSDCNQFDFSLCALLFPLPPPAHRCWSWGNTPINFSHVHLFPRVCFPDSLTEDTGLVFITGNTPQYVFH